MIYEFPLITIGGIQKKAYSIDLSGGGSTPATLKLSFLTDSQVYTPNTSLEIDVYIGAFYHFTGYIITVSTRESASGNITEVSLIDTSIKLDKLFVGLKGKHGPPQAPLLTTTPSIKSQRNGTVDLFRLAPSLIPPNSTRQLNTLSIFEFSPQSFPTENLVLVGDAIDPCKDLGEEDTDPCDPCSTAVQGTQQQAMNCAQSRSFQILDVDYNFNDLINALVSRGFSFNNRFSSPTNYRAQYTGTAREVLNNWCQDFGYTYYWKNNTVVFVNLAQGIRIDDTALSQNCVIEDKTTTLSIENNSKRINIAYFGKAGEIKEYDCNKGAGSANNVSQNNTLLPISLSLLMEGNGKLLGDAVYKNEDNFRKIVAAGHYNKDLRDLFCWTQIYGYMNPPLVKIGKHSLMGWDVKAVCHAAMTDTQVAEGYDLAACKSLYNDLLKADPSRGSFFTAESITKLKAAGAYFVVVSDFGTKAFDFEQGVAEAYCGKYWIRSTNYSDAEIVHPDGNSKILKGVYGNPNYVLPDLNLSHPYVRSSEAKIFAQFGNTKLSNTKVILLDRPQYWVPASNDPVITDFMEIVDKCKIQDINYSSSYGGLKENDKLFLIYSFDTEFDELPSFSHTLSDNGRHSIENVTYSPLGLKSNKVYKAEFALLGPGQKPKEKKILSILMPSEATYKIKLVPNKSTYTIGPIRAIIPKFEYIVTERDNVPSDNCVSVAVNFQNLTDNALAKLSYEDGKCFIDRTKVFPYLQGIIDDLSNNEPFVKKTISYTVLGIPTAEFTLTQGLVNFSVRMDSGGTRTNLTFSNSLPENTSENIRRHELNYLIKNQSVKTYINNTL